MQVTMLGTGGPLSISRRCLGMVVTADGCEPLLIDTCGGFELIAQLHGAGFELTDITNVVVTHRHMDHAGGMQAIILASRPVVVHALADTLDGIERMRDGCFPEWRMENASLKISGAYSSKEIKPRDAIDIGGFKVEFFEMVHRVPTVAVRVTHGQRVFTYSADSLRCDQLVAAARNADLFLCDALYAEAQGEKFVAQTHRLMHPTAREAGSMARAAGVKTLACVHTSVFGDQARILEEAAEAFGGPATLPSDLAKLAV